MSDEALMLPEVTGLVAPPEDTPLVPGDGASPYVFFVSDNKPAKYNPLCEKLGYRPGKLPNGTPVLMQGGTPVELSPCTFLLTPYVFQHWSRVNTDDLSIIEARTEQTRGDFMEHVETVVIVLHDGGAFPARLTFRGPKCPAAKQVKQEQTDSKEPGWASRSRSHADAATIDKPWLRVVGTLQLTTKDGKKGPYQLADAVCEPIAADQADAIRAAFKDEGFRETLKACVGEWDTRVKMIKSKVR